MQNTDKLYHFIGGFAIALTIGLIVNPLSGLVAGVCVGALKEVYDYSCPEKHTTDGMDFIATVVGTLVGVVLL